MKVRLKAGISLFSDRECERAYYVRKSVSGEIGIAQPDILFNGQLASRRHKSNQYDTCIVSEEITLWAFCSRREFVELSPLELLALEAE
jgi:hypothetical protein